MSCDRLQILFDESNLLIIRSVDGITKIVSVLSVHLIEQQNVFKILTISVTAARRRFES